MENAKLKIGDQVAVTRLDDDFFSRSFPGIIVGNEDDCLQVEDPDGDVWDCVPEQLSSLETP